MQEKKSEADRTECEAINHTAVGFFCAGFLLAMLIVAGH